MTGFLQASVIGVGDHTGAGQSRVPEGVPSEPLLNSDTLCGGADVFAQGARAHLCRDRAPLVGDSGAALERPHKSLAYRTPLEFLNRWNQSHRKAKWH